MSLDAAIAQLQAIRVALAQSIVDSEDPQDDQDDTPNNECNHVNRTTVATMGTPVSFCTDCGEQIQGEDT